MSLIYKKIAVGLPVLIAITVFPYLLVARTQSPIPLLPAEQSTLHWISALDSDSQTGGSSQVSAELSDNSITIDFTVDPDQEFPFAHFSLAFADIGQTEKLADLSAFSTLRLKVRCTPDNVLRLAFISFDENVTRAKDIRSYRNSRHFFSCSQEWSPITIDFDQLEVPDWWLNEHALSLSDQDHKLEKVLRITLGNSLQSPRNIASRVEITGLQLSKPQIAGLKPMYFLLASMIWVGYFIWFSRKTTSKRAESSTEQPAPEEELPVAKDFETTNSQNTHRLLDYIASHYKEAELSLETLVKELGLNRNKVNQILKENTSLTFSSYLNQLRQKEAARLLSNSPDANVTEIAYAVGYNNASYFIKLFKQEYGCTPKKFKDRLYFEQQNPQ